MILSGTGIIDSSKGPVLPAEIVVGTGSTDANKIIYSTQDTGDSWAKYSGGIQSAGSVYDVIYNGTMWIAVGINLYPYSGGYFNTAYSMDGVSWTKGGVIIDYVTFTKVAYNGIKYLALTTGFNYYSSMDGINWTKELGLNGLINTYAITYQGGFWYIGGNDSSSFPKVYRSADGVSWTLVGTFPSEGQSILNGLSSNGSRLVASLGTSSMYYSNNGTTWTKGTTTTNNGVSVQQLARGIIWCGAPLNRFIFGGFFGSQTAFKLRQSTDGITWTSVDTSSMFGSSGTYLSSLSVSGLNWDGTYLWLTRLSGANTTYPGVVFRTTDMVNFTRVLSYTQIANLGTNIYSIATKV